MQETGITSDHPKKQNTIQIQQFDQKETDQIFEGEYANLPAEDHFLKDENRKRSYTMGQVKRPRQARGNVGKGNTAAKNQTRNQKYKQLADDKSQLRYTLIYCDDTLLNVMNVKRQLTYCRPANDEADQNYSYCEQIGDAKYENERQKNKLRAETGLFFDFNVSASPKRKLVSNKNTSTISSQKHLLQYRSPQAQRQGLNNQRLKDCKMKLNQSASDHSQGDINLLDDEASGDVNSLMKEGRRQRNLDQKMNNALCNSPEISYELESESEGDNIIVPDSSNQATRQNSRCNEIKLFQSKVNRSSVTYSRQRNDTLMTEDENGPLVDDQLLLDEAEPIKDNQLSQFADEVDDYQRLRDFEEYLYENYTSPTVLDLQKAKRMKEIEQIDQKCENFKKLLRIQRMNTCKNTGTLAEVVESDHESQKNNSIKSSADKNEKSPNILLQQSQLKHFSSPNVNQFVKQMSKTNLHQLIARSPQGNQLRQFSQDQLNITKNRTKIRNSNNFIQSNKIKKDYNDDILQKSQEQLCANSPQGSEQDVIPFGNQQSVVKLRIKKQVSFIKENEDVRAQKYSDKTNQIKQDQMEVDGKQDIESLFGVDVNLIEPNSALIKKPPDQIRKLNSNRRPTQLITAKMLDKKRKLSEISGKSQTGSDNSDDVSIETSSNHSSFCIDQKNSCSKFDNLKQMHNHKKCIFTRKVHNKKQLILQKKILVSQDEIPHIAAGISQIDLDQLSNNGINMQKQQIGEIEQAQSPAEIRAIKQFHIQKNAENEKHDKISYQLIENQTANTKVLKPFKTLHTCKSSIFQTVLVEPTGSEFNRITPQLIKKNTNQTVDSKGNVDQRQESRHSKSNSKSQFRKCEADLITSYKVRSGINKNQKRERKKNIKRLMLSRYEQGEEDFLENQKTKLNWLQKLSEQLKGKNDHDKTEQKSMLDENPNNTSQYNSQINNNDQTQIQLNENKSQIKSNNIDDYNNFDPQNIIIDSASKTNDLNSVNIYSSKSLQEQDNQDSSKKLRVSLEQCDDKMDLDLKNFAFSFSQNQANEQKIDQTDESQSIEPQNKENKKFHSQNIEQNTGQLNQNIRQMDDIKLSSKNSPIQNTHGNVFNKSLVQKKLNQIQTRDIDSVQYQTMQQQPSFECNNTMIQNKGKKHLPSQTTSVKKTADVSNSYLSIKQVKSMPNRAKNKKGKFPKGLMKNLQEISNQLEQTGQPISPLKFDCESYDKIKIKTNRSPNSQGKIKKRQDLTGQKQTDENDNKDRNLKIEEIRSMLHGSSQFTLKIHNTKIGSVDDENSIEKYPRRPSKQLIWTNKSATKQHEDRLEQHQNLCNNSRSNTTIIMNQQLIKDQETTNTLRERTQKEKSMLTLFDHNKSKKNHDQRGKVMDYQEFNGRFCDEDSSGPSNLSPQNNFRISMPSSIGPSLNSSLKPSPDGQKIFSFLSAPGLNLAQGLANEPYFPMQNIVFDQSAKRNSRRNDSMDKLMDSMLIKGSGEIKKDDIILEQPAIVSRLSSSSNRNIPEQSKSMSLRKERSKFKLHGTFQNYNKAQAIAQPFSQRNYSQPKCWKHIRSEIIKKRKQEIQRVSNDLKLQKHVTDNIRNNIEKDLDDLQTLFHRTRLRSPVSIDSRNKKQKSQRKGKTIISPDESNQKLT